jgi:hypothetical protein
MPQYFNNYADGPQIWCDITTGECEFGDSLSRIVCAEINILSCGSNDPSNPCSLAVVNNGTLLCDCGDSVNCNLCGSDLPYFNPVLPDDSLYFQFQQIDNINGQDPDGSFYPFGFGSGFINGFVKDCCTGNYIVDQFNIPRSITAYAGGDDFVGVFPNYDYKGNVTWLNLQAIRIDVASLLIDLNAQFPNGNGCFIFEFVFNYGIPSNRYSLCSEPFQINDCPDRNRTVLLRGDYPSRDCFNYYYGTEAIGTGNFNYVGQYRVPGVLEQNNFEITKESVGPRSRPVSSEIVENYDLRTYRVPQRVAGIVANILSASVVYANGFEYIAGGEISKNNDTGLTWFVEAKLSRIRCQKILSCPS